MSLMLALRDVSGRVFVFYIVEVCLICFVVRRFAFFFIIIVYLYCKYLIRLYLLSCLMRLLAIKNEPNYYWMVGG